VERREITPVKRASGFEGAQKHVRQKNAGMPKAKRKRTPKTVLRLPDLEQSRSAVLNGLTSPSSQRAYDHAIRDFIDWYCSEPRLAFNRIVVTRYRITLEQERYAASTINLRLAAVRRLAYEAADAGLLSPDLAAGIRRVKGAKKHGVRLGNWLTSEQGRRLLAVFDRGTVRGKRDYAMIAVLLGCGLRRLSSRASGRLPVTKARKSRHAERRGALSLRRQ
jgi:integrase